MWTTNTWPREPCRTSASQSAAGHVKMRLLEGELACGSIPERAPLAEAASHPACHLQEAYVWKKEQRGARKPPQGDFCFCRTKRL
jgi:hypothetical protein